MRNRLYGGVGGPGREARPTRLSPDGHVVEKLMIRVHEFALMWLTSAKSGLIIEPCTFSYLSDDGVLKSLQRCGLTKNGN